MSGKRNFFSGMAVGLLLSLAVIGVSFAGNRVVAAWKMQRLPEPGEESQTAVNERTVKKLQLIENIIKDNYALEPVDEETMEKGMYQGMIASLGDPYSAYFSADELSEKRDKMEGIYYGIGCYVLYNNEMQFCQIGEIFPDSPAEKSGICTGDLIIKVDDVYVRGKSLEDVVGMIRGEKGTTVVLTLLRKEADDYVEIEVERKEVPKQTVNYEMLSDQIGYIRIKEFDNVTVDQFADALATLKGSDMLGLVLDLRDNLGGNVSAVVEIARKMLPRGIIVYTEDKNGKRQDYSCNGENELTVPLVVLVNGNSASASEILAGAIKDYGKGKLLGTTTYGKGVVQKFISMSDGSAVKLTTSKYYTPKGNNIHGIGIKPDEELELDYEKYYTEGYDNQLERAKKILVTGE